MNSSVSQSMRAWEGGISTRPLKIAIVREEFVALTQDPLIAIVLNQMVYWSQRVKDFDLFLEEEKALNPESSIQFRHGWIFKTAEELIEETMLRVSRQTMRKYLKLLVDQGWIEERFNSQDKWDKTTQYRVNLRKIQNDLFDLGYGLAGFSLPRNEEPTYPSKPAETSNVKNLLSNVKNLPSNERNLPSKVKNLRSYTYTEITAENTNREHAQRAREFSSETKEGLFEEAVALWKSHIGQEVHLTKSRKHQITAVLKTYFQNDLSQWELFCERIKSSPFLMGEGPRKWHVTLDWILVENNLLKILEGNFDDPNVLEEQKAKNSKEEKDQKLQEILDSIDDPVWKYWCSQLAFPSDWSLKRPSLSMSKLKAVSQAQFLEAENGKLIWIGSSSQDVLNHIENMRLELLSIVQRTFPNSRNIRTRLLEPEDRNVGKTVGSFVSQESEDPNGHFLSLTCDTQTPSKHHS